uniref:Uncharacterized protein n=1 Tax=Spodoptera frugiperda ascovirus 1a TaxID=113370 RepID=Q9DKM3_SFAVA|nr:hypothetical protein [Spodoptera frugiperda ascovirus 1a]
MEPYTFAGQIVGKLERSGRGLPVSTAHSVHEGSFTHFAGEADGDERLCSFPDTVQRLHVDQLHVALVLVVFTRYGFFEFRTYRSPNGTTTLQRIVVGEFAIQLRFHLTESETCRRTFLVDAVRSQHERYVFPLSPYTVTIRVRVFLFRGHDSPVVHVKVVTASCGKCGHF